MSFADDRLPTDVGLGFTGGPEYSTDVVILFSGHEQRNQNRADGRGSWQASYDGKTGEVTQTLIKHFRARRGAFQGFPFKDHVDYDAASGEGVFVSLGGAQYQMYKRYTSGGTNHDRKILLPVTATLALNAGAGAQGSGWSVARLTGIVTMLGSPSVTPTSWTGEFDVPVRYTQDKMTITVREPDVMDWGDLGLIELLETT